MFCLSPTASQPSLALVLRHDSFLQLLQKPLPAFLHKGPLEAQGEYWTHQLLLQALSC